MLLRLAAFEETYLVDRSPKMFGAQHRRHAVLSNFFRRGRRAQPLDPNGPWTVPDSPV